MGISGGFNEFLPVTTAGEQEHKREGPHEADQQEDECEVTETGAICLDDLGAEGPKEVT